MVCKLSKKDRKDYLFERCRLCIGMLGRGDELTT